MIAAVLFDLDGTLIDCMKPMEKAFVRVIESLGIPLNESAKVNVGNNLGAVLLSRGSSRLMEAFLLWRIGGLIGVAPHKRVIMMPLAYFKLKHIAETSSLYKGVPEALQNLQEMGLRLAIVTTRSRKDVLRALRRLSIESYFEVIIAREDAERGKPFPEPVLKALEYLNLEPSETVMVGDMPTDIQAGRRAGTRTIGLMTGIFNKELIRIEPDVLVHSINDVPKIVGRMG